MNDQVHHLERFVRAQAKQWNAQDKACFFELYTAIAPEGLAFEYLGNPVQDGWKALQDMWLAHCPNVEVEVLLAIAIGDEVVCHNRNRYRDGSGAIDTLEIYRLADGKLSVRIFINR